MTNVKVVLLGVVLAVGAGCKKSEKKDGAATGSGSGSAAAGSGSAAAGSGSDVAAGSGSAAAGSGAGSAAATCDVVGDYRLRFASNGAEGHWWRFKVTGTPDAPKGELVGSVEVLGIDKPGPVDVTADVKTCTLTVVAKHGRIGDMTLTATLDPATNKISGTIVRAKPRYPDEKVPHPAVGSRSAQDAAPAGACVKPGAYKLKFDGKAKYTSDSKENECDVVMLEELPVRVEYLGDQLFVDLLDEKGTEEAGRITVKSASGCDVEIELADAERKAKAKLTFAADKITGTASEAEYQMIEDGEAGENMWMCTAKNVAVTGAKN